LKIARIVPFILFGNYFDFWQKIKNEKNKNLVSVYWPASKSADAEIQLRRESDLLDLQICWTSDLLDSQFCWITRFVSRAVSISRFTALLLANRL
jgi:hypothetical protein